MKLFKSLGSKQKTVFLLATLAFATLLLKVAKGWRKRFVMSIVFTVRDVVRSIDSALEKVASRNMIGSVEVSDILLDLRQMVKELENNKNEQD